MTKRLWQIFGPILVAAAMVDTLLLVPWHWGALSAGTVDQAAVSMAPNVLAGERIKDQAFADGYLPLFGSSELARMDPFHPAVYAEKYHQPKPFLLGAAGTQSLTHFVTDQSSLPELRGKKAVVILSLQWFTPQGQRPDAFGFYYSPLQMMTWLRQANPHNVGDRYAAKRLLKMPSVRDSGTVAAATAAIAKGHRPNAWLRWQLRLHQQLLRNEDGLFSRFHLIDHRRRIEAGVRQLPTQATPDSLTALAEKIGRAHTTNNRLGIDNHFFARRLAGGKLRALRGSQTHFDYLSSPEYGDFQLLLQQFAENHIDVQFVIPPINQRWARYTGLSLPMVRRAANKVQAQLRTQGFTRVLNLSNDGNRPYFMQDTIHLGWAGWVRVDTTMRQFVHAPNVHDYHLRNRYYSQAWQRQTRGW